MDEENKTAVEEETQKAATEQTLGADDYESRVQQLEAEKARLVEEAANWKVAALKYKKEPKDTEDESEDERVRRIAREAVAESRLIEIAREQDEIIKKALKENKELKLAHLNKTTSAPPANIGTHSESTPVMDTLVTPEQLAALKERGWSEKDIERYKKNLQRYSGR